MPKHEQYETGMQGFPRLLLRYLSNRRRHCFEIQSSETLVVGLGIIGVPMALGKVSYGN